MLQVHPALQAHITREEIESILHTGFLLAIPRWDPTRGSFEAAALNWMRKVFWTAPEVLRGCPEYTFRLIGLIWRQTGLMGQNPSGGRPTNNDIAKRINENGGFGGARVTGAQVTNALAVAVTMDAQSLTEIQAKFAKAQDGDASADPMDDGSMATYFAAGASGTFSDPCHVVEVCQDLEHQMAGLPLPEQRAFWYAKVEGMTSDEIAREMHVRPADAKRLVRQALACVGGMANAH